MQKYSKKLKLPNYFPKNRRKFGQVPSFHWELGSIVPLIIHSSFFFFGITLNRHESESMT